MGNCSAPRRCNFSGLAGCCAKVRRPANNNRDRRKHPELFVENWPLGLAGIVIPPLYDSGFDFTGRLAAVLLGGTWHPSSATSRADLPGVSRSAKP